jgi:hypothetical protein
VQDQDWQSDVTVAVGCDSPLQEEVMISCRPSPDGGDRHQMGKVQRMHDRLANIGVWITGQAPEPGLNGIQSLTDGGEPVPIENTFDGNSWRRSCSPNTGRICR